MRVGRGNGGDLHLVRDGGIRRVDYAAVRVARLDPCEHLTHIGAVDGTRLDLIEDAELRKDLLAVLSDGDALRLTEGDVRNLWVEHCLEVGEVQLAVLCRDQHDVVDEKIDARTVREELLLVERIHLLLCGGDEYIGGSAVLDRLLEGTAAAEVVDDMNLFVVLLVHRAEFLHRVCEARRCGDLQLDGALLRRLHLVRAVAAANAAGGEQCRARQEGGECLFDVHEIFSFTNRQAYPFPNMPRDGCPSGRGS